MLSLSVISSSSAASSYFEKDDYYVRDGGQPSAWHGKGAEALGLSGPVDRETFQGALEGKLPNGEQLGRTGKDGAIEHKPGWDLTFSAPKSVSVAAEVGGDERLIQAHDEAARKALDFVEARAAITRLKEGGEVRQEHTGNLAAALFRHDTSRALDPQLHTHAVVLNATQRQDGEWRSLESREIYRIQKEAGMVYRAELAAKARELGYTVEKTHDDGRFELKEIPEAVRDHFSKRAEAVEKALAERGKTRETASAKEKETITKDTRDRKQDVDRSQLRETWKTEARALGYDPQKTLEQAKERALDPNQARLERLEMAEGAVRKAVAILSEREASFRKADLERTALERGFSKVSKSDIEKAINRLEGRKELLGRDVPDRRDNQIAVKGYTTPGAVKLEQELSAFVNRGKGMAAPMGTERKAEQILRKAEHEAGKQGHSWTDGQREATSGLLTDRDRVVGIQGAAGTAKTTTVLKTFGQEAQRQGYQVRGLAPSASAAKQLEEGGGIKSQTIHSFLSELKSQERQIKTDLHRAQGQQIKAEIHGAKAERGFRDGGVARGRFGQLYTKGLDGQYHRADIVTSMVHGSMQLAYKMFHAAKSLHEGRKAEKLLEKAREAQHGTQKNVWVVDEASMVGAKQMAQLLAAAEKHNARVVLVGDRQQLGSVEAGRAFGQMQDLGMKTYRLEDIVRQRDQELKNAVDNAYRGHAAEALNQVDRKGGIVVIADPKRHNGEVDREAGLQQRAEAIKQDYLSLSKSDREKSIVIAPGHDDRRAINEAIRTGLKGEGTVRGNETTAETLQNKGLTKGEAQEAGSYRTGDVIRFGRDYQSQGVSKGDYWRVAGVDQRTNVVTLEKDGKTIAWDPAKWGGRSEAYRSDQRQIAAGDKIIWNRNDQDKGLRNGETAKVLEVKGNLAKVELQNGKTATVDLSRQKHWDYAYARTSHSAQGATAERAFIHAESWRVNLQHQRNLYVGISRAKQEVKIYTESKEGLLKGVQGRTGEKTAAMAGASKIAEPQSSGREGNGREGKFQKYEPKGRGGEKAQEMDRGR